VLKSSDLGSFLHHRVKYLPSQYNGDAIYELPPILAPKEGAAGRLVGMDRSCDGHAWMPDSTYNYIHDSKFPGQGNDLVYLFKMSTCGPASGVSLVRRMPREEISRMSGSCLTMLRG
jgi:hypothetical protein